MKIKEMVIDWLKSHGYEGLCNQEIICGCGLDDFMPCDGIDMECEPAMKKIATEDDDEYGYYEKGDTVYVPIESGQGKQYISES